MFQMKNTFDASRIFRFKFVSVGALFAAFALFVCFAAAQTARAQLFINSSETEVAVPSDPITSLPTIAGNPQNLVPTLVVTKTADTNDGVCNADCSLREALDVADGNGVPDVIGFNIASGAPGCTGIACTVTLTSVITPAADGGNLTTIDGEGANTITISGGGTTKIMEILANRKIGFRFLTIANGNGTGGIFGPGFGGALFVYDTGSALTLDNVTMRNNSVPANSDGGALNCSLFSTVTITNSTFNNNNASNAGGAIAMFASNTTMTNVTVSTNVSGDYGGGGINNYSGFNGFGTLNLTSVTVAFNTASGSNLGGGGVSTNGGGGATTNIRNSIVSNNTKTGSPDVFGPFATESYNFISRNDGSNIAAGNPNANQSRVGTIAAPLDPQLQPLADNGGRTQTHALLLSSPAVDKGNSFGITQDQRGSVRPFDITSIPNATGGDGSDIGAFELLAVQADLSVTKTDSPDPVSAGGNITYTITVTNNGPDAATVVTLNDVIPANTTFVSVTAPAGFTCPVTPAVGGTGTVTCTGATLANAASATFALVVNVNQGATGTISNTATAASSASDPNTANNSDTETTAIRNEAALGFTLVVSPDPVASGGTSTYVITLTNSGNTTAQNVVVTQSDFFRQRGRTRLTVESISAPPGFTCGAANPVTDPAFAEVVCRGTLAAGQTAQFTIVKRQRTPLPNGTIIYHEAEVTTDTFEANTADNRATDTTTVGQQQQNPR